jgi:hypothetical protein
VVIDLASKAARAAKADGVRVFALDTGRLPDETYMTAERVRMKYGVEIEWLFPEREPVEQLIRLKGLYSFRDSLENRHECCGIRKVEPLGRALAGLDAWVTGLRSEQSVTRSDTPGDRDRRRAPRHREAEPDRALVDGRGPRLRRRAQGADPPAARSRLPVDRLRALHARDQAGRARARRPLVVGGSREQGVRDPHRATCPSRSRRSRRAGGVRRLTPAILIVVELHGTVRLATSCVAW